MTIQQVATTNHNVMQNKPIERFSWLKQGLLLTMIINVTFNLPVPAKVYSYINGIRAVQLSLLFSPGLNVNEWKVLFGLTDRVTDRAGRFVLKKRLQEEGRGNRGHMLHLRFFCIAASTYFWFDCIFPVHIIEIYLSHVTCCLDLHMCCFTFSANELRLY